ncbi:hypothetical protein F2P79_010483 [Pimephales promelas]|nr:hypothetical protein F2P79_010483 [Pimephales promelas]
MFSIAGFWNILPFTPRGRDCLCVCCRLQYALFTGRFGFENNTSLEGRCYLASVCSPRGDVC